MNCKNILKVLEGVRAVVKRPWFCLLKRQDLSVVGHIQAAVIIFPPFRRVGILPMGQVLVLRVPEHQIGDVQLLCQPAGIHDRAVVLFVGLEALALAVQAERLMEQPLGAFDPGQQRLW